MKIRSKQITFALSFVMMSALFADGEESLISDNMENFIVDSEDNLIADSSIENFIADNSSTKKGSSVFKSSKKKETAPKVHDQFTIFGDFLYWKADVEGTEFAESGPVTAPVPFTDEGATLDFKTLKAEGRWEPGVRAGIGYKFSSFDDWDLSLVWTHLNTKSKNKSVSVTFPNIIFPIGVGILGPIATDASAHWKLNTNILDLEVGRAYCPTKKISLKPHVGVRGAWFDYRFKEDFTGAWVFYDAAATLASRDIFSSPTSGKNRFDFKGIGLKGGFDGSWFLSSQWSIEARFSASLLSGKYKIRETYNGFNLTGVDDGLPLLVTTTQNMSKDFWRVRTNIEGFLGLMWKIRFNDNKDSFFLSAGYELSQWFQLNEIPTLVDALDVHTDFDATGTPHTVNNYSIFEFSTHGDVSFQGLTARVGFEF